MKKLHQLLGLLALARGLHGESLPYNPTRLFLPTNSSSIYMFRPSSSSPNQAQFLKLDVSDADLSTSSSPWHTISESLPFLHEDKPAPYTPAVEADGSVTVIAGDCREGASGMEIWRMRDTSEDDWSRSQKQGEAGSSTYGSQAGSNFLSSSIAFSQDVSPEVDSTQIFTFGGMCPSAESTAETWTSSAKYSNLMLTFSPVASSDSDIEYRVSILENRGPPIEQAGVSMTPLPPTFSLSSSGNPDTQQQNFVLLGGHTQTAFINMSQVAVFSLPQQSWSFMPVEQPTSTKTDLAVRQNAEVTPRSGHTAVISDDGTSIVLFGGWVGDVNTPATPQLAVLELGDGYGGSGEWKWTVPQQFGQGLESGAGIYGHGAVMLPGGVMMVVGGYEIPAPSSRRVKRATQSANTKMLFYNATSGRWLDSYTPPVNWKSMSQGGSGPLSSTSQKIGLGTGLGVGAAVLMTVVGFYIWYSKRLKRAREDRERSLLTYSSDGSSMSNANNAFYNRAVDGRGGDGFALGRFWPTGGSAENDYPRRPEMQHTTGMFVDKPSPTRGLRRGVQPKNYQYQPAPLFEDNRAARPTGIIHPIAEQENEDGAESLAESLEHDQLSGAEAKLRDLERVLHGEDPFVDSQPNPLGSHPVSPYDFNTARTVSANRMSVPARKPIPEAQAMSNWMIDHRSSEEFDESGDRSSFSRSDDRTSSNLSERSHHSAYSGGSLPRSRDTRTGAMLAAAAAAHRQVTGQDDSPTEEHSPVMPTVASYFKTRKRASTNESMPPGNLDRLDEDDDSFMSARSNFVHLQGEGEALLGGRPKSDPEDPYQRAMAAQSKPPSQPPSSFKPPPLIPAARRRPGLIGSLRKALNVVSMGDRTFSLGSGPTQYKDGMDSSSSSPTKDRTSSTFPGKPRRAVSDGGALLRHKRGQSDWEEKDWPAYHDDPDADDWGEPKRTVNAQQAEEDWDVEGAASKRDFQVMFSVPKSRLRVVNDDMDRASLRSASDGAVSRHGSTKTLTREESMKALRARAEGERPRLPSHEEEDEKRKSA